MTIVLSGYKEGARVQREEQVCETEIWNVKYRSIYVYEYNIWSIQTWLKVRYRSFYTPVRYGTGDEQEVVYPAMGGMSQANLSFPMGWYILRLNFLCHPS